MGREKKKLIGVPLSLYADIQLLLDGKAFIVRKKGKEYWSAHEKAEDIMREWGSASAPLHPSLQERIAAELLRL